MAYLQLNRLRVGRPDCGDHAGGVWGNTGRRAARSHMARSENEAGCLGRANLIIKSATEVGRGAALSARSSLQSLPYAIGSI